jgi:lipopolysaccharide/colanic/teichoic acid biosynthesis glycosyltransferase
MSVVIHPYYSSQEKAIFDRLLAVVTILLSLPILICISLVIFLTIGQPVIYVQNRMGRDGKKFKMYKFRTMRLGAHKEQAALQKLNQAPGPMFKIFDDPRFVGAGKWLSKSGLDELPQLFNVLLGDMSFVGPRPLPVDEAKKLGSDWDFRYLVRPGVFSEWTIAENRHRSLVDWKKLDLLTLSRGGWFYDLKIINKTLLKSLFFIF